MKYQNPIHQAIFDKVVMPTIKNHVKRDIEARIIAVNYQDQTVDIFWTDPDSGTSTQSKRVPLPKDADGVFRQSIKVGDKVAIAFRNGSHADPYISVVYKNKSEKNNYQSKFGSSIPKGMGYL